MKIFVTGGTGFIGSHFIECAQLSGHEVVALKRCSASNTVIPLSREPIWLEKAIENVSQEDLKGCDAVVHFAATGVSPQPATWSECFDFNVQQSLSLLEKTVFAGVDRFITSGTFAEYGKAGLRYDKIPSDASLEPTDPYAASKAASFIALTSYARNKKCKLYYGRIFSAFGEGQFENNLWPSLRKAALAGENYEMTKGEQIRDYIPVEQVAITFLKACESDSLLSGEPLVANVASGDPVTIAEITTRWWNDFGADGELRLGAIDYRKHEVMRYIPLVEDKL